MLFRAGKAKEYKSLSDWLVKQPWFRDAALKTHAASRGTLKDLEEYLDKELLNKNPTSRLEDKSSRDKDIMNRK